MADATAWRTAPVEATPEMLAAGRDAIEPYVGRGLSRPVADQWQIAREVYAAMVQSAPQPASPWLPIESAPKDGTEVLALEGSGVGILSYDGHYNIWKDDGCDDCWDIHHPTHWQPIPEPPTAGDADHG